MAGEEGVEKMPAGVKWMCRFSSLYGTFPMSSIGGERELVFPGFLSWRTLWGLLLIAAVSYLRAEDVYFMTWSSSAGTQQGSSTDMSASDIAYYITMATTIFSILYWHIRGRRLARLLNVVIHLDEERERRNSFWGLLVSQILYVALYGLINVFSWGTIVHMSYFQMIYRFLMSAINFHSTIGHALLYYWICNELASTLVHFRDQVTGSRITADEWMKTRGGLESCIRDLNRVYGYLLAIHMAMNAVNATIWVYLMVRVVDAVKGVWFLVIACCIYLFGFFAPLTIYNLSGESILVEEEWFWKTMARAAPSQIHPDASHLRDWSRESPVKKSTPVVRVRPSSLLDVEQMQFMDMFYRTRKIRVTAAGFVRVGKETLSSVVNIIVTYIVILFQFQGGSKK